MPTFTDDEVTLIKGSYDFFGVNHYTTTYTRLNKDIKNQDWISDRLIEETFVNATGNQIGPMAQSTWLAVYGPGLRKLLNWIKQNYGDEKGIYIFENGVSVPGET